MLSTAAILIEISCDSQIRARVCSGSREKPLRGGSWSAAQRSQHRFGASFRASVVRLRPHLDGDYSPVREAGVQLIQRLAPGPPSGPMESTVLHDHVQIHQVTAAALQHHRQSRAAA
jgi:hypothetical protein